MAMVSASEALERLKEGNRRFVESEGRGGPEVGRARRAELVAAQSPFAIILGCSDSRVPSELVFDQGLGDLFVIRVAGNVVARSQIGSIEFAAEQFGSPLVVVMGHSRCGAVHAALEQLHSPGGGSQNLGFIVERIQPCLKPLIGTVDDGEQLLAAAVRANVRASVEQLKDGSDIIRDLIASGRLQIVGAEYSLDSGEVEFFHPPA